MGSKTLQLSGYSSTETNHQGTAQRLRIMQVTKSTHFSLGQYSMNPFLFKHAHILFTISPLHREVLHFPQQEIFKNRLDKEPSKTTYDLWSFTGLH